MESNVTAEKRIVPEELNGPMDFDIFLFMLSHNYDNHEWIEVRVDLPAKSGGTISVLPEGYPPTHTIQLTIGGDKNATAEIINPIPAAFIDEPRA